MMAAIVAPSGRRNIASTRSCFEPGRLLRSEPALVFALPGRCFLRADFCAGTEIRLREALVLDAAVSPAWAGAGRTLVSLGAAAASSSTLIASRPVLVMRSAIAPLSSSRRQTGSAPPARTSSSRPASHELIDDLSGGFAFDVRRQFNGAIIALRSRG